MGYQEAWDNLYNVMSPSEKVAIDGAIKEAADLVAVSTDSGIDLINFRVFIETSRDLLDYFQYHLGDLYLGQIVMGVVMLCDYFDCSPFAAVNLWKSGQAVPVFRANMPYAIRRGNEDIAVQRQLQDKRFTHEFVS